MSTDPNWRPEVPHAPAAPPPPPGRPGGGLSRRVIVAIVAAVVLGLAAFAGLIVLIASSGAERDGSGTITQAGDLDIFDLRDGDCIEKIDAEEDEAYDVPVVPCEAPHIAEVYAVVQLSDDEFPGDAQVTADAEVRCDRIFPKKAAKTASAELFYYHPTETSWEQQDDRAVTCILEFPTPQTGRLVR